MMLKRVFSIRVSVLMVISVLCVQAALAAADETGSFCVVNYNFAGLPRWITGTISKSNQTIIGQRDAWTEVCNNGDYENYEGWKSVGHNWGQWDSVEMNYV